MTLDVSPIPKHMPEYKVTLGMNAFNILKNQGKLSGNSEYDFREIHGKWCIRIWDWTKHPPENRRDARIEDIASIQTIEQLVQAAGGENKVRDFFNGMVAQ